MDFGKKVGFQGLEANVRITLGMEDEDDALQNLEKKVTRIRSNLEHRGLEMAAMGIWQLNFIDENFQNKSFNYYQRALKIAKALSCPVLFHGTGKIDSMPVSEQMARYMTVASKIVKLSENHGVKPCIYSADIVNFAWHPSNWEELFSSVPKLGLKYDPSHLCHKHDEYIKPLADLLAKYGNRIYHVHIKDVLDIGGDNYIEPPAGMGDIRWNNILALLYTYGYEGYLSLEPRGIPWFSDSSMRQLGLRLGMKHLQSFLL